MALTDIDYTAGQAQHFIIEIAQGTLGTPADIHYNREIEELVLQGGTAAADRMDIF